MTVSTLKGSVRPAAQAGRFYDDDPDRLREQIQSLLASHKDVLSGGEPVGLLAPHAGYPYSGRVAAAAYRLLQGRPITHVLILAPTHYGDFIGAALPSEASFATPLGRVSVDQNAIGDLMNHPDITVNDSVHSTEHAVEVQLPFLQVALGRPFTILPVVLGRPPAGGLEAMAEEFMRLLNRRKSQGEHWLVLASSDTYHGYDPADCLANDEGLMPLLEQMDGEALLHKCQGHELMACGWVAIILGMRLAWRQGARKGRVLLRSDSGMESHVHGDYIVGYISAVFT